MNPVPYLVLMLVALGVRVAGALLIGPSPFGPDAPGIAAAVELGGHPYPLHPLLVGLIGGLRPTSVILGTLAVLGCARLTERLDGSPWSGGLLAACAPLFVFTSALDGGDAPALGLCALGLALAFSDKPLGGAILCGLSLAVKPIVAPALVMLLVAPALSERPLQHLARMAAGLALSIAPFHFVLDPLLAPKPRAGLLGSWFLATNGDVPSAGELFGLFGTALETLVALPSWTGHPVLGILATVGALLPGPHRRQRLAILVLAAGVLLTTTALLGEATQPRWLAAASLPLVALAGVGLRRAPPLGLVFLPPGMAALDGLAAVRAVEDPGTTEPIGLSWPGRIDSLAHFRDSSICGAHQLRGLVGQLSGEEGPVYVLQLRDGREGELTWPLQVRRPDLEIRVVSEFSGYPMVAPGQAETCQTELSHHSFRVDSEHIHDVARLPEPGLPPPPRSYRAPGFGSKRREMAESIDMFCAMEGLFLGDIYLFEQHGRDTLVVWGEASSEGFILPTYVRSGNLTVGAGGESPTVIDFDLDEEGSSCEVVP